jgi:DNA-binding response OmpR family regulator
MSQLLDVNDLLDEAMAPAASPRADSDEPKQAILLVTSSQTTTTSMTTALQSAGYDVFHAVDAFVAAEFVKEVPTLNLILLDTKLPGVDGFQFCKMLRDGRSANLPIVLLARRAGIWTRYRSRGCGAAAVIRRNCRANELLAVVKCHALTPAAH